MYANRGDLGQERAEEEKGPHNQMGGPVNANKGDLDEEDWYIFGHQDNMRRARGPRVTMSISI